MNKIKYVFIIFILSFLFPFVYSECTDGAMVTSVEFSLNENSFSFDYDGNSGVIQRINFNSSSAKYSLWQTSLLNSITSKGDIYSVYSGNDIPFEIDSNFLSNKNNMLIINPSSMEFDIYMKLTIKNTGSCRYVNNALIASSNNNLRYYGVDNWNSVYSQTLREPSEDWFFTNADINAHETKIFRLEAQNFLFNGKVYFRSGPKDFQEFNTYFWVNGPNSICGDGFVGYQEYCDDGNTLSGDYCSADCKVPTSVCGDSQVDYRNYFYEFWNDRYIWDPFSPQEVCDIGISYSRYDCSSDCRNRVSICGDGLVQSRYYFIDSWRWYTNPEVCDTALNGINYDCSSDCSVRYSTCGNGIRETSFRVYRTDSTSYDTRYYSPQEECDDGNLIDGDGCSSSCQVEGCNSDGICNGPTENSLNCPVDCNSIPSIQRLNYLSSIYDSNSLQAGDNITLFYNITNPNSIDIDFRTMNRFYYIFYSNNANYWGSKAYFHEKLDNFPNSYWSYNYYDYYVIPAYSSKVINHTIAIRDYSDYQKKVNGEIWLYEYTYYRPSGTSFSWKNIGGFWRQQYRQILGSYYPQYCVDYLKPNDYSLTMTTNDDGVPSIKIDYEGGIIRANNLDIVPNNSLYLNSTLELYDGTNWIFSENQIDYINQSFQKHDSKKIYLSDSLSSYPELEVKHQISFPIYNFTKYNQKSVRFNSRPFISQFNSMCYLPNNEYLSSSIPIELSLIRINVDNPIILRPKGQGGYDELYARLIMFNYEDYSINNISFDIYVENFLNQDVSNFFEVDYLESTVLPAGSAMPIYFKIKYVGPEFFSDINYKLLINLKYEIPHLSIFKEKTEIVDLKLEPISISPSNKFVDLIPIGITYSFVNIDENSVVKVKVANQGTKVANNVPVDFYVKSVSDADFIHHGNVVINPLAPGAVKEVSFNFLPTTFENYVLKVVVNENLNVYEDDTYIKGAKLNNILTSITMVRDLDVELVYLYPEINSAKDGIIPFKVFARNKGVGGIGNYELRLNVTWKNYTYISSFFFNSIPEEGYENTFYWNVTQIEAHPYIYKGDLFTLFDRNLSDNTKTGALEFCPLPWGSGALSCKECTFGCLNKFTSRYQTNCDGMNTCKYYNETFAKSCGGYLEGSYAEFNETHIALCPSADIKIPKFITYMRLDIRGNCDEILIKKSPVIFKGESVLMNIVLCKNYE